MKSLGLFETKNRLSEVCDSVANSGEPVVVTRHGKPLVRIVPATYGASGIDSVWDTVAESEEKYGRLSGEIPLPSRDVSLNRETPLD